MTEDHELVLRRGEDGRFADGGPRRAVKADEERARIVAHLELVGAEGASAAEIHKALRRSDLSGTRKLLARMADGFLIERRGDRYRLAAEEDDARPMVGVGVGAGAGAPAAAPGL